MKSTVQISIQALNMLFSNLATQSSVVFWMRSADFKQQLYVSPTFNDIWGIDCSRLYEHPESWYDTLVRDDRDHAAARDAAVLNTTKESGTNTSKSRTNTSLYRIHRPDASIRWMKDDSFSLYDINGNCIGIAGLSICLPEAHWEEEVRRHFEQKNNQQQNAKTPDQDLFSHLLHKALEISSQPTTGGLIVPQQAEDKYVIYVDGEAITLSKREAQCIYHLLEGRTAKQTGVILHLSQRTVETYLDNIKKKTKCRTKLELLKKVDLRNFPIVT